MIEFIIMVKCLNCGKNLNGRQTKYCSRQCKNICLNQTHQSYEAQKKRGRERKLQLIDMMGKKCNKCGYGKNFAALEFHHLNPKTKMYPLDLRSLSNRKWEEILHEAKKCILLCSNCHSELHNPQCLIGK